jgi:hypothetical protein
MSDLKRQLRSLIDGLEEPVSVQETMERGQKQRRFRAPVAALAGAAVVLIPAMVLVGLRLLPGAEGETAGTTIPPTTVTTTTVVEDSTTTQPPTVGNLIVVPDLVGLTEQQARDALLDTGLELVVAETRFDANRIGVSAQEPLPGAEVESGSTIVVDVYVVAGCPTRVADVPAGSMHVSVMRHCPPGRFPAQWQAVSHYVPSGPDPIAATVEALLAGPDSWEEENGYSSFFSMESADALNSVTLDGNRIIIDFNDNILIGNASTSNGSLFFLAELQANLYQFEQVESIEFRLNGSCDAFMGWLQAECQVFTRGGWESSLEYWQAQNDAQPEAGREVDPTQVIGLTYTATLLDGSHGIDQLLDGRRLDSGFDEVGGWLLDDASTAEMRNWALHVAGQGVEMVWLAEGRGHTDEGHLIYQVHAVVELPWDEVTLDGDPLLMSGNDGCLLNGEYDPALVVMTAIGGNPNGEADPLQAWLIDTGAASFSEVAVDGIECVVETG